MRGVHDVNQLDGYFASGPNGYTPLTSTFNTVLAHNQDAIRERKLLVMIVTDGEPTDNMGNVGVQDFRKALSNRTPIERIFVTIVACTDDDESISYLNRWDREIRNLDVVDDFRNEKSEVQKAKGRNYRFSYGDYVVKSLIGAIDPKLDQFDEKAQNCCCSIF